MKVMFPCRLRFAAAILIVAALPAFRSRAEVPLPQIERLKSSPVLQHLKPNPMPSPPRTPAGQTVAQMHVPEGFRVELVAAEPDVHQPIAFAFDERGRIWVAEAYSYPTKRPPGEGMDKIVIFDDRDGDGQFETRKVFAEGLNLVSGFEVGYGGVWVGAAPELFFIPDRNHDDIPDSAPMALLDGFGFQDTHECLNSFLWGPDGWLYGIQGVFNLAYIGKPGAAASDRQELRAGVWRYHPVRHEFEVFAHGGSNPWGIDYDERGQLFMTHCRSYWGRGGTTHVIQGGHFWNQANANYAPFVIANPPEGFPAFRNYLLASARYDHGAGGAGAPGSDAIYGGHSHVGTMIYFGDNWPEEFRGRLFTHNLHGHQINQQINKRLGSGFDTVHAGKDQLFCSDPKYVAIDLQYGPDGAVYMIDWYDQQHCHNPNTERWDRGNGRIYRMQWQAAFKPVKVDLSVKTDVQLVELLGHKNAWFARTARRLLHERSLARAIDRSARNAALELAQRHTDAAQRLNGLWTLHAINALPDDALLRALTDKDEYVRGWAIQLAADDRTISRTLLGRFVALGKEDSSPVVRLNLASAIQRVPESTAWKLVDALAQHAEDRDDRNLPLLLWQGMGELLGKGRRQKAEGRNGNAGGRDKALARAFAVAEKSRIPQLADWISWYACTLEGDGLNRVTARLASLEGDDLRRSLAGVTLAMDSRPNPPMPVSWRTVAPRLYANSDPRIARQAERVGAAFGDDSMFPRLRETLNDRSAALEQRRHAFSVLSRAQDRNSLAVFLSLLDDAAFRSQSINLLARFDAPEVSKALLDRFESLSVADRSAALNALTSRASFAVALLDAVSGGKLRRDALSSFYVRQLTQLKNTEVDQRVTATWGRITQSPAEKQEQIGKLEKVFNEAPLWAFDSGAGRQHFEKLCVQCHKVKGQGAQLGPELSGAGKNGIRYFLENIIDPNAVIGTDFQMTTIDTKDGDVISGILANETPSAVTIRTTVGESVVAKSDIERREVSDKSLMPEALLDSLNDRERIELLKFLTSN